MIMMFGFDHSQPVLFYISPIFIIGLISKAFYDKCFYVYWKGIKLEKRKKNKNNENDLNKKEKIEDIKNLGEHNEEEEEEDEEEEEKEDNKVLFNEENNQKIKKD